MSRSAHSRNKKAEGTGYSQPYSFEEALRNAIESLSALPEVSTEQVERIKVMEVGVERGGLPGFNRLFVRVRRLTLTPTRIRTSSRNRQR
jgi:hypothetical protein